MIAISVLCPAEAVEKVSQAMFSAGAGRDQGYDQCCFITQGIGQFRPLEGSKPYIGKTFHLEKVEEWKIETICAEENFAAVVAAIKQAHPYEVPSWHAFRSIEP